MTKRPLTRTLWYSTALVVVLTLLASVTVFAKPSISGSVQTGIQAAPAAAPAIWRGFPATFPNTVVHWTQINYTQTAGVLDPANAQVILDDAWARVGSDGTPQSIVETYTFQDGTFHQELVLTPSTELVIYGPRYATQLQTAGLGNQWCIQQGASDAQALLAQLPPFANVSSLPSAGYVRQAGTLTLQAPMIQIPQGATPASVDGMNGALSLWTRIAPTGSSATFSVRNTIEADARGHVQAVKGTVVDSHAAVLQSSWATYSPIHVYDARSMPSALLASVFGPPAQLNTGCAGETLFTRERLAQMSAPAAGHIQPYDVPSSFACNSNPPVSAGGVTMNSRDCYSFPTANTCWGIVSGPYCWGTATDTSMSATVYKISVTTELGQETCNGSGYINDMVIDIGQGKYNTNNASPNHAYSTYNGTCTGGHGYRTYGQHWWQNSQYDSQHGGNWFLYL